MRENTSFERRMSIKYQQSKDDGDGSFTTLVYTLPRGANRPERWNINLQENRRAK